MKFLQVIFCYLFPRLWGVCPLTGMQDTLQSVLLCKTFGKKGFDLNFQTPICLCFRIGLDSESCILNQQMKKGAALVVIPLFVIRAILFLGLGSLRSDIGVSLSGMALFSFLGGLNVDCPVFFVFSVHRPSSFMILCCICGQLNDFIQFLFPSLCLGFKMIQLVFEILIDDFFGVRVAT